MGTELITFDNDELALIKATIAKGTTDDQLKLFIQVCKQTGLNPFARQIYAVVRNAKKKEQGRDVWVPEMSIQTSIDGYRLLAQRSGEYAGQDGPYFLDGKTKEWLDYWIEDYPPVAARVGVMRKGFAKYLYAVAKFESYAVREYSQATSSHSGALKNLWGKMPEVMIAKVAEALALRRAFPAELSGIYTKEEMDQADVLPVVPVASVTNVVEAQETRQVVDHATAQENKPVTLVDRRRALYDRALALGQFQKGATGEETLKAFLAFTGTIIEANITNVGQLTTSRLDDIEAYLNAKDAA